MMPNVADQSKGTLYLGGLGIQVHVKFRYGIHLIMYTLAHCEALNIRNFCRIVIAGGGGIGDQQSGEKLPHR